MKRGTRKLVPAPGTPKRLHTFGAYNWRTSRVSYTLNRRKNSDSFIEFLETLTTDYPDETLILVMDNASYHHSKAVQAALSLFEDRVHVYWLPKYSPFLNMIERFWLHFKQLSVANRLHLSLDDLAQTAHDVMAQQNTANHPNQLRLLDNFRSVA
jgi:transposase